MKLIIFYFNFIMIFKNLANLTNRLNTLPANVEIKTNILEKNQDEEKDPIFKTEEGMFSTENDENQFNDSDEDNILEINHKKIVYTMIYTIIVAECGDRSQISSILLATVYNFTGVMVGTTVALFCTILLAVYLGGYISKYISEKTLNYVAGVIFLLFGLEIFFTKTGYF